VKRVILLADDSPTIQRLVLQTFVDTDFQIVSVSNGDAAIRKFDEVRPDLVLADIFMPGKNGYEVCDYVKKHPERGATPVILLAGAFDAFDQNTARSIGAATHITKPFEPHALVDLVESLTAGSPKAEEPPLVAAPAAPSPEPAPAAAPEPEPAPQPAAETFPGLQMSAVDYVTPASEPVPEGVPAPVSDAVSEPASQPAPEPATVVAAAAVAAADAVVPAPAPQAAPVPPAAPTPTSDRAEGEGGDLLGLNDLFKPASSGPVTEEEIERIADRVIKKLSTQVIENVAWDVVPEITSKVLKDELKRES
jgi:CheY-like chemotaxis protein